MPMAEATFSRGNSSRMMPKVSGRTPPPMPWITRAAISTPIVPATAASSEPTASAPSAKTSIRSLPTLSPTRPMIGVKIDADTRYAVSTQVTVAWSVCERRLNGRQHRVDHGLEQGEGGDTDAQHQEGEAVVGTALGRRDHHNRPTPSMTG